MNEENEFYEEYTDDPTACNDYEAYDNGDENIYDDGYEEGYEEGYESGCEEDCEHVAEEHRNKHTDSLSSNSGLHHNIYGTAGLAAGYAATRKTGTFHRPPDKRKPRILVNPSYTRYPEPEESKVETCIKYGCGTIILLALIVLLFSC